MLTHTGVVHWLHLRSCCRLVYLKTKRFFKIKWICITRRIFFSMSPAMISGWAKVDRPLPHWLFTPFPSTFALDWNTRNSCNLHSICFFVALEQRGVKVRGCEAQFDKVLLAALRMLRLIQCTQLLDALLIIRLQMLHKQIHSMQKLIYHSQRGWMNVIMGHRQEQLLERSIVLKEADLTPYDLGRTAILLLLDRLLEAYGDQFHSFQD